MKAIFILLLVEAVACGQTFVGHWQGTLQGKSLHRLVLNIAEGKQDTWSAVLYSIDDYVDDEPIESLTINGPNIVLKLIDGEAAYKGVLSADGSSINGTWNDKDHGSRPVQFRRATKETAWKFLIVSDEDIKIVRRAREILDSPTKWNRVDNRECPKDAKTFSLYCALELAAVQIGGHFEHRASVMQEARFVIDYDLAPGNHYHHRLMDYNNDARTTFTNTRRFFDLLEQRCRGRLEELHSPPYS
jgi:hypothetical protein